MWITAGKPVENLFAMWKTYEVGGNPGMVVRDQKQALSVAVDMETRAIKTYERALMITRDDEVAAAIREMLEDERRHLRRFTEMLGATCGVQAEDKAVTGALAAEALFTGGVMEMHREHALDTVRSVYEYAADSEQNAVQTYLDFALKCEDASVKEAFCAIAQEEATHLADLNEALAAMDGL